MSLIVILFFLKAKMNYITTDNVIGAAKGVPKQSRKCQNPVKITNMSVNAQAREWA